MVFSTAMRFSFLAKLSRKAATRWRVESRKVILLYHRIASPQHDPFALAVPEKWFQDHLDILKSHCRLVTLDEILGTEAAKSPILASITFDDGYTDNLTAASPMLCLAGIPATFFICTGCLGDVRGFWWDRLANAIGAADPLSPEFEPMKEPSVTGELSSPDTRRKATLQIASRLQRMHPLDRDRVVAHLENVLLARGSEKPEPCPVLDEAGVRELGSQPVAQLGAHTHNHAMLSMLRREEQLAEINRSVTTLEDITGTRPRFVAYPYGSQEDYNTDSCLAARDAGLQAAFVNHAARFDPKGQPYRVPRYYVPPLPADQFRTWLLGILRSS
jgi:peptidoglycan/xylan/chitin deacetylase (PgdA/CDA1 family)